MSLGRQATARDVVTEKMLADQFHAHPKRIAACQPCNGTARGGNQVGDVADADIRRHPDLEQDCVDRIGKSGIDHQRFGAGLFDRTHQRIGRCQVHRQPGAQLRLIKRIERRFGQFGNAAPGLQRGAVENDVRPDPGQCVGVALDVRLAQVHIPRLNPCRNIPLHSAEPHQIAELGRLLEIATGDVKFELIARSKRLQDLQAQIAAANDK